ncbi:MAG: 5'-methylthioadenosine/adenosylhomocysteine nucleosidase [Clostridiales bacterium]|jgi:adenosylhomocysteine nucleosidase|nr:5'-methylthioadenosine/adenosylhomocysteine nucleosidase [Clostridiales bacterium]
MKTIGIIGAMEEEITSLKSKIEVVSAKNIIGVDFYMGTMHGKNVVVVRSGIGKVNAAICTQVLIDLYAVDYIINVGVAGALAAELEVGDVVISNELMHHDFDTTSFGDPIGVIPRMGTSVFKSDEALISIAKTSADSVLTNNKVFVNRICSGDKFVAKKEDKSKIWSNFKAYCVEMEGAAIAQTCFLNKIPFVVIRSITDKADESADKAYTKNVDTASTNSCKIVEDMLLNI